MQRSRAHRGTKAEEPKGSKAHAGTPSPRSNGAHAHAASGKQSHSERKRDWFTGFALETAHLSGRPVTFLIAVAVVAVWAIAGPIFNYSDTWQLIINTGTTIVTFLMVFLIQNTQNRDTMALQIKLAELIIAMHGAKNTVATIEDLCDEDLEALHEVYRHRADEALDTLHKRRRAH